MKRATLVAALLLACTVQASSPAPRAEVHHRLELRFDEQLRLAAALDHVTLPVGAGLSFSLSEALVVDRLSIDGRQVDPKDKTWRETLSPTTEHTLVVEFHERAAPPDAPGGAHAAGRVLSGVDLAPQTGTALVSFDLRVETPAGLVAIAPGQIASEDSGPRTSQTRFVSEGPTDDIALFIGPYVVKERLHGGRRLRTYLHPQVADLADLYLDKTAAYIDLYEERIGGYPFSQFFVVSGTHPVGLGFPGLTYMGIDVLRLPFIPDTSLGHEVLHSWWGNGVLGDTSEGNWVEGLTTFMADYAYAVRKGPGAARDMRLRWLREYAVLPPQEDRPLTAFRGRRHTASQVVGYHKAAMLFLMLRDELGEESFDAGLRRFWSQNRFRRATWTDVQSAFEGVTDRSLDAFFSQWLHRGGAPSLRLRDVRLHQESAGAWKVDFVVTQEEPAYHLLAPVEVEAVASTVRESVRLQGRETRVRVEVPARPTRLRVDPHFRLFRRLHADEVPPILRSVAFDPEAVTVIAARDGETRAVGRELAAAFFERTPEVHPSTEPLPGRPLLLVGTTEEVARLLPRAGLSVPPRSVAGKGSARSWATRSDDGVAVVVVAADDRDALRAVVKPLPHYGSQSFVVFEGSRAVERGLAAAGGRGPLEFEFQEAGPASEG